MYIHLNAYVHLCIFYACVLLKWVSLMYISVLHHRQRGIVARCVLHCCAEQHQKQFAAFKSAHSTATRSMMPSAKSWARVNYIIFFGETSTFCGDICQPRWGLLTCNWSISIFRFGSNTGQHIATQQNWPPKPPFPRVFAIIGDVSAPFLNRAMRCTCATRVFSIENPLVLKSDDDHGAIYEAGPLVALTRARVISA